MMKRIALITGASSGLGREFATTLANKTYTQVDEIWLIARRKQRLGAIAKKYNTIKFKVIPIDLTSVSQMEQFVALLERENPKIQILVNSAGYGKTGAFTNIEIEDYKKMIDLNIRALTLVTYACIPFMCKGGKVIQLASSAGFIPQPNFAVYSATKSYVIQFSRALNCELMPMGISVLAVCPGPVRTEFLKIANPEGLPKSLKYNFIADPKKVVKKALRDAFANKDISVYGTGIKLLHVIGKIMPHRILTSMVNQLSKS